MTDPNHGKYAWVESNYDYRALAPNFWVCDAQGSLHNKPFLTLEAAQQELVRIEAQHAAA